MRYKKTGVSADGVSAGWDGRLGGRRRRSGQAVGDGANAETNCAETLATAFLYETSNLLQQANKLRLRCRYFFGKGRRLCCQLSSGIIPPDCTVLVRYSCVEPPPPSSSPSPLSLSCAASSVPRPCSFPESGRFRLASSSLLEHAVDLVLVLELECLGRRVSRDALTVEEESESVEGNALAGSVCLEHLQERGEGGGGRRRGGTTTKRGGLVWGEGVR